MRFLKFFGGVGLALLMFLLLLGLFMKDKAETTKSVFIKADAQTVFRMINSLQKWEQWSPFYEGENDMKSVFAGPDRGVGNSHSWQGSANKGEQEIVRSEPYSFIQCRMDMGRFADAADEWRIVDSADGVKVSWTLKMSKLSYPFHRYFGYFLESTMSPLQKRGLENLRQLAEAQPKAVEVLFDELPPFLAITRLDKASPDSIDAAIEQNLRLAAKAMNRNRIAPEGPAFALFDRCEPLTDIHFRTGFPVAEESREDAETEFYRFKGTKMAYAQHFGSYATLLKTHQEILEYLADFGLKPSAHFFIERYDVGPLQTGDTTLWQTTVYCPID